MACIILESLNAYCDELIGETSAQKKKKKIIVNENIDKFIDANLDTGTSNANNNVENKLAVDVTPDKSTTNSVKSKESDFRLSDRFQKDNPKSTLETSASEHKQFEALISKKGTGIQSLSNVTDDGFKIVSSIPSDDSDVSNAFEWSEHGPQQMSEKRRISKFAKVKKPLMDLIKDFDMEDKLFLNKNSKLRLKRSASALNLGLPKKKCLSNKDITVIDYSVKKEKKKRSKNDVKPVKPSKRSDEASKEEIQQSFKEARHEVFKMGLSGFDREQQKDAKIKMIVRLGAKPPRNKAVNYKQLIEERKLNKEFVRKDREEKRRMGLTVKKPEEKTKRNKDIVSIQAPPLGKFKNGVLTLSKKDMKKVNNKR